MDAPTIHSMDRKVARFRFYAARSTKLVIEKLALRRGCSRQDVIELAIREFDDSAPHSDPEEAKPNLFGPQLTQRAADRLDALAIDLKISRASIARRAVHQLEDRESSMQAR